MYSVNNLLRSIYLLLALLITTNFTSHAQDIEAGKKLFNSNCAACHHPLKKSTGPALKGAASQWEDREMLYKWVKNSQDLVKSGYPRAVQVFEANNKSVMTAFPQLKNEDIDNILAYVDQFKEATPPPPVTPVEVSNKKGLNWGLVILSGVLLLIVLLLSRTTSSIEAAINKKEGYHVFDSTPFFKTKWFRTILTVLAICIFCYALYDQSTNLGRQQGYAPDQPIKYSHALHAGKLQIQCLYCHAGADKAKIASVPTAMVCMNCHKEVQEGTTTGKTEIAKIYEATGWDADAQAFSKTPKPIEWVRIHNLPDHVYFNHSQHVTAGKIACQKCHGEIQTMEKVEQFSDLSMGWCIDCHRTTEVQFADNNYYKMYEDFHRELEEAKKAGKTIKMTEAKMGGEECQKCHY